MADEFRLKLEELNVLKQHYSEVAKHAVIALNERGVVSVMERLRLLTEHVERQPIDNY